ncbi:GNAT family N-acetyltransferase [Exiguobacterium sp. SH1S21]|uniref:GNAT family N-acetyltransferase n=1 Tax=Exiguobacterium sp. SH1S21 TaxID=2510953 RepID=UPI00103B6B45|nr:GNAT family N-acetyltransferase [Exiguobacterium sp. SH1S21]TCI57201.1 GNAT family N-acetyltransferase [Exiguobacterium sp. SH1S21]
MNWIVEEARQAEHVTALEGAVNAHDAIDVKIGHVAVGQNDYAVYDGETLVGYLMLFPYLPNEYEVNALVHPDYRKQGVFTALLTSAKRDAKENGCEAFTFVIDRKSKSGKAVVDHIQAAYQFSEYNLVLKKAELFLKPNEVSLREATDADRPVIIETLSEAFGDPVDVTENIYSQIDTPDRVTYIGEVEGRPVGVIRALLSGDDAASIHAFGVRASDQGQGYGTKMLKQMVQQLFRMGRTKLELDVETENKAALEIYKRAGFAENGGYEFYLLEL